MVQRQNRKLTSSEKEKIVKILSGLIESRDDILFAYIFGSFASKDSFGDIDLGIFVKEESVPSRLKLELKLEEELQTAVHVPTDVKVLNSAHLTFVYNVLKSGFVIVDKDKSLRADFEGLICKKYFDFSYLRKEYLREITHAPV
jgi:predicted nucleotidyltransferase